MKSLFWFLSGAIFGGLGFSYVKQPLDYVQTGFFILMCLMIANLTWLTCDTVKKALMNRKSQERNGVTCYSSTYDNE